MELLAPVGNREALYAAIENGADAVYLGGKNFSARQSAENFSDQEIARAVEYAHGKNRKVYVTINTLIDHEEFGACLDYAWKLHVMGVDAVIVQDVGLMRALTQVLPELRLHASTQMTIHNAEGVKFLEKQGIKRVVLAREMTLAEIQKIKSQVHAAEIEVFVHGALCFSYSGQCLFSSMVGGRSGNRGRCAQPCRLPYDLYSLDTQAPINTADKGRYLLSPSDLCLIDYLPELRDIGVNSLKIEGRMKRAEYTAVVTRAYREVLDIMKAEPAFRPARQVRERLLQIFNRSFSSGYFVFDRNEYLSSKRPNNRGVYTGRVISQDKDLIASVRLSQRISLGDGLEIWVKKGKNPSFIVKGMKVNGLPAASAEAGETAEFKLDRIVSPHDRVFKTHDQELVSEAMGSIKNAEAAEVQVDIKAILTPGQPLQLILNDERGHQIIEYGQVNARVAENKPLEEAVIRSKIERLGNTPFYLGSFECQIDGDLIIPFSDINETRRRAVERLKELRLNIQRPSSQARDSFRQRKACFFTLDKPGKQADKPELTIAVSGLDQAYAAAKSGVDTLYLDLAGIGQKERISIDQLLAIKDYSARHGCRFIPALPRIQKPSELRVWEGLKAAGFDTLMTPNIGSLYWAQKREIKIRADYSFNIFNPYSLRFMLQQGSERVCLSPELNFNRLKNMGSLRQAELMVHGDVILMTSQYCMLQGILRDESGSCPGLCRRDRYGIRDDKGYIFPVDTDTSCRFYVFNSRTLCMIDDLDKIIGLGVGGLRIEARHAQEQEVVQLLGMYRQALEEIGADSSRPPSWYREELERKAAAPLTRGHYYRGVI